MAINIQKELSRIHTDRVCDRIPVASTVTNLVDLFQKIHFRKEPKEVPAGDPLRYSVYIKQKSIGRCLLLLLPGLGNFIVGMHDIHMKRKSEKLFEKGNLHNGYTGINKIPDRQSAITAYTEAAKLGHIKAMVALANFYREENQPDLALEWFKRADVLGDPEAKDMVARVILAEAKKAQDADPNKAAEMKKEAAQKLEEAADAGNAGAQVRLAQMVAQGDGVAVDLAKAFELAKAAADQDDRVAQFNVANMLYKGEGVKQDRAEAFKYFEKAAIPPRKHPNDRRRGNPPGNPQARYMMGLMLAKGEGVDQNAEKALDLTMELVQEKFSYGHYLFGYLYENGLGVKQNLENAKKQYQIAADKGVKPAQEALERLQVE